MICNFLFLNKYFNNDSISEVLNIARRLPGFFAVGKDNIHASRESSSCNHSDAFYLAYFSRSSNFCS